MGLTYTFCFCTGGGKCKGLVSEKDKFNEERWSDVRKSVQLYLKEPVCVPGATGEERAPKVVYSALTEYMKAIAECRTDRLSSDYALWHERRVKSARALGKLSALPTELLSRGSPAHEGFGDIPVPPSTDTDETSRLVMEMGQLLVQSFKRAAIELVSAVQGNQALHVFHHFGLLQDIVAEMHALAIQASAHISTENLLPDDHPHKVAFKRRQKEHSKTTPKRRA